MSQLFIAITNTGDKSAYIENRFVSDHLFGVSAYDRLAPLFFLWTCLEVAHHSDMHDTAAHLVFMEARERARKRSFSCHPL